MVMNTPTTASVMTQDALYKITSISQQLATVLAEHGEVSLIAGLAHAIGVSRIIEAASAPVQRFFCEAEAGNGVNATASAFSPVASHAEGQGTQITYYVAGCDGAKRLARRLGRTVFKIGYTCHTDPAERLVGLNGVAYGGWAGFASAATAPDTGWNEWSFARHDACDTDHVILPYGIKIEDGLWRITLPAGVDPEAFDRIVTGAMMSRQLAFWATSGAGRTHCQQKKLNTNEIVRFSPQRERLSSSV